jgi:hypothetical protein
MNPRREAKSENGGHRKEEKLDGRLTAEQMKGNTPGTVQASFEEQSAGHRSVIGVKGDHIVRSFEEIDENQEADSYAQCAKSAQIHPEDCANNFHASIPAGIWAFIDLSFHGLTALLRFPPR